MTTPRGRQVLVLAAMPIELRPLTKALSLQRGAVGTTPVYRGRLPGTDVAVLASVTGVGPARAEAWTETLLSAEAVDRVVMIGIAGGLDPTLAIGDLVVPVSVIDEATGHAYHPVPAQEVTPAGVILTSSVIHSDPAFLDRQRGQGVTALDMETAAVGAVAERHRCPWSAFRAISDRVQDGLVDQATLAMTNPDGTPNLAVAARTLLTHPGRVPRLIKLGRDTGVATRVAAEAGLRECRAFAAG